VRVLCNRGGEMTEDLRVARENLQRTLNQIICRIFMDGGADAAELFIDIERLIDAKIEARERSK
jgi:hypothetical protein